MSLRVHAVVKDVNLAKQKYSNVVLMGPDTFTNGYIISLRGTKRDLKNDPNMITFRVSETIMSNTLIDPSVDLPCDSDDEDVELKY